jgi:hypothetical protein
MFGKGPLIVIKPPKVGEKELGFRAVSAAALGHRVPC